MRGYELWISLLEIFSSPFLLSASSVEISRQTRSVTPSVNGLSTVRHTQSRPSPPRTCTMHPVRGNLRKCKKICNTFPPYSMIYQITMLIMKCLIYNISPYNSGWLRGRDQLKCDVTHAETRCMYVCSDTVLY